MVQNSRVVEKSLGKTGWPSRKARNYGSVLEVNEWVERTRKITLCQTHAAGVHLTTEIMDQIRFRVEPGFP